MPSRPCAAQCMCGCVQGHLFWGDVRYVVLDEADTMFDRGFGPEVRAVLAPLRSKAHPAQVVLVVATLSQARLQSWVSGFSGFRVEPRTQGSSWSWPLSPRCAAVPLGFLGVSGFRVETNPQRVALGSATPSQVRCLP